MEFFIRWNFSYGKWIFYADIKVRSYDGYLFKDEIEDLEDEIDDLDQH